MAEPEPPKSDELTPQQHAHVEDVLAWIEKTLGVSRKDRFPDNDWMLIVKFHAMIETGLNAALTRQFGAPELSRVISKLDTGNTATGKVAFAKALEILDPSSAVFIQKLSELRNFCVHDVRNFGFQLEKYLDSLSEDKRKELVKPVMKVVESATNFREALFGGVIKIMMELQIHDLRCENRDLRAKVYQRGHELYEKQKESNPNKG